MTLTRRVPSSALIFLTVLACITLTACNDSEAQDGEQAPIQGETVEQKIRGFKDQYAGSRYKALPKNQAELISEGKDAVTKMTTIGYACVNCHYIGEHQYNKTGPALDGIASRYLKVFEDDELATRRWLYNKISDASAFPSLHSESGKYLSGLMPKMDGKLGEREIMALVEYLMTLKE